MASAFRLRRLHPSLALGGSIAVLTAAAAALSLFWTPHDIAALNIANRLQPPSATFWLGTDHFGRDIASLLLGGAGNSVAVALAAVGLGMGVGVPLGLAAAAAGGVGGEAVMRASDFVFAFPALVVAIMFTAVFGPGAANAVLAIGIFNIPVFARVSRGAALSLWAREFTLAARVAGKSAFRISLEHVLPNISSLLIVQGTIQFSIGILFEAGLSYLGLGTQPPAASWGRMLAEAQTLITLAPQLAIIPGLAIMFTVLGVNLLGDGLRDILDPRLQDRP